MRAFTENLMCGQAQRTLHNYIQTGLSSQRRYAQSSEPAKSWSALGKRKHGESALRFFLY
jgi:hypothetical protein